MNALTSRQLFDNATPIRSWTREQKLDLAIDALAHAGFQKIYDTIRDIENPELDLDAVPVARTIFEPIAKELENHGIPTAPSVGAVMRSLELERRHVHALACYCHEKTEVMLCAHSVQLLADLIQFPDMILPGER